MKCDVYIKEKKWGLSWREKLKLERVYTLS